jgi:alpha-mannosidase
VEVTTRLELRTGEPFVRVSLAFTNPARDHRVRYHVPLPTRVDSSAAEGQLAVVDRGLTTEAGHGEVPLPTFPAHGFVHVSGVTLLLEHVSEYEVVEGRELALTILRSVGLISRNDNPSREDPAGPEVRVPGAQLVGPWRFGFAVMPHPGGWEEDGVLAAAEAFHLPVATAAGRGDAAAAMRATAGLVIEGSGVVLSALRRRDEELEVRLVAEASRPTTALLTAPSRIVAARDVDLLGRPGDVLPVREDGTLAVSLTPWQIRTIRLTMTPA